MPYIQQRQRSDVPSRSRYLCNIITVEIVRWTGNRIKADSTCLGESSQSASTFHQPLYAAINLIHA